MATVQAIFGRPDENAFATATVTVQSGSGDANYVAANLTDKDPSNPAKLTGTTGAWQLDLGSAKSIPLVGLGHHNLVAGLTGVKIQANSSASWGAPPLDVQFTIPTYDLDGFSVQPWLDLSAITNTYRYWLLKITNANTNPVAVGELVGYTAKHTLEVNYSWGAEFVEDHPIIEHVTERAASLIYEVGTKQGSLHGEVDTTDAGRDTLLALSQAAWGRSRGFLWIPDGTKNKWQFVRLLKPDFHIKENFIDRNTIPIELEEVSRGTVLS